MLNLRSDELRGAKTTASASAAGVTQRHLQIRARPRSPSASRQSSANLSSSSSSSSSRMPDRHLRAMSSEANDLLRRVLTSASTKALTDQEDIRTSHRTRGDSDIVETKRMMGRRIKDRDLGISSSGGPPGGQQRRDQQDDERISCACDPACDDDLLLVHELQHMGFGDAHRALAACAYVNNNSSTGQVQYEDESDGDEDQDNSYLVDTPELAAFLGLTIPAQHPQPPPMFPKAASFSGHQQGRNTILQQQHSQPMYLRGMVPCSPPVPIPRKQLRRRRNSVTGSLLTSNDGDKHASHDLRDDDMNNYYSRSQCEARLWDDDWHFKLSLEARESFEASSSNNNNTSLTSSSNSNNNSRGVWKPQSTASMASTADTFHDEDESTGDSGDDDHVFDMDDL